MSSPDARRDEVAANLEAVRGRIAAACAEAGRAADDVRLVVVTKFFPASDVRILAELGVTDVGENRHQEAEAKAAECADLGLAWHFIGGLQSNKAAAVAAYSSVVESVDRRKLVRPLSTGATSAPTRSTCCSRSPSTRPAPRAGPVRTPPTSTTSPRPWPRPSMLELRGLMAVAPLGEDPAAAFARLADVRRGFLARHPDADLALGGDERATSSRRSGPARHTCALAPRSSVRGPPTTSVQTGGAAPARGRRTRKATTMSGAMRRIGEYLGLLEDTGRYDDEYADYDDDYDAHLRRETSPVAAVARPSRREAREARQATVADISERRRPAGADRSASVGSSVAELSRITTLHPRTYNEARTIGENFRDGTPVIMNLSEMDDSDAKRLVDFAAGLVFATRGSIERITSKVSCSARPTSRSRPRRRPASSRAASSTRASRWRPPRAG